MNRLLRITVFLLLVTIGSGYGHASELDEELQAIQTKLGVLGNGEETPQKKRLREIYNDHQQVLLDHQEYLKKTANYSRQLEQYPKQLQQLEKLKRNETSTGTATTTLDKLAKLPLEALEQRYVAAQADLSNLQNQQQKLAAEITKLRQRAVTVREELASVGTLRAELAETPAETQKTTDKKILNALANYQDAQLQALTDKTRMLELESLVLPNAIEAASLQEKLTLIPGIQALEQEAERLAEEISQKKRVETEQVVEKSQQLLVEKEWQYLGLKKLAQDNQSLAKKLSSYAELSSQLVNQKTNDEKRLALVTQSYTALQQRLELKGEDTALGTEVRKQFKEIMIEPAVAQTERALSNAKLELFQFEQEKLQMMNERGYFKQKMNDEDLPPNNTPAYQQLTNAFYELKQSREQMADQLIQVLHGYIKELQLHLTVQQQLVEKIGQHQLLLKENLLLTRNAEPISMDIVQNIQDAMNWMASRKIQAAIEKTVNATWKNIAIIFTLFTLIFIIFRHTYWPVYYTWIQTGNNLRGRVNQDRLLYPVGMLLSTFFLAGCAYLPFQLSALVLRYSVNTEIGHAFSVSFQAAAIAMFVWVFLLLLLHPEGMLIGQLKCAEKLVHKMYQDVRHFAPVVAVLSIMIAFTDALDDDLVRNGFGRLAFILLCLALAIFASSWMALTRSGKALYQGESFKLVLHPAFWMSLFFIIQISMIAMAAIGYYFAAIYQYLLIFQSIAWAVLCALVFFTGFRSLLIIQRQIAFERAIEKREEIQAQRAASGKSETDLLDDNYIDVKTISKQSATVLKISVWALLITGLGLIWVDVLPAFSFLEKITIWRTSVEIDGEVILQPITLKTLLVAIIILSLSMIAAHNLPGTLELLVLRHLSLNPGTGYAMTTLLRYTIVIIGLMITLQKLGMEWSNIQWLVAALSVGLGFGLQEVFANFVSGLILLFERPIRIGDVITLNNISGTVSKIHIRATTLIDGDRKEVIVPNKIFITQQLTNWTLSDQITRIVIPVGITYRSDCDKARALLLKIAHDHPLVLRDPEPAALLLEFGATSLNFELRVFTGQLSDRMKLQHELHMLINQHFAEEGIKITPS
ncbi:mechanosensitive ion channel protein MscS [Nitrosomonas sp. HPC101]|uniref:mechanosensitive ion channel domain-containing protein n=1 Tax=Nitrosomonas sp. HPC101 TaxID=1658667 RepID=UPI00136E6B20|nr:mechanosensitive ion channel domain-containing protein [Nitrosomonas sp. HPC101]MXS85210.1 mechanosensitive ion channel protein MscS [Nitrosomonas sp. HPC101]